MNDSGINHDSAVGAFILTETTIFLIFDYLYVSTLATFLVTILASVGMVISITMIFPNKFAWWYWAMGGFNQTVRTSIASWMWLFFLFFIFGFVYLIYYKLLGGMRSGRIAAPLMIAGYFLTQSVFTNSQYDEEYAMYSREQFTKDYLTEKCNSPYPMSDYYCGKPDRIELTKTSARYVFDNKSPENLIHDLFEKYRWRK